mmetsp:Transcript_20564/g.35215  ORF Transcript_20564/g.35215 Transcript_20564/m.35215 type:complete len:82 (-) Transcript_20564:63-308(-)
MYEGQWDSTKELEQEWPSPEARCFQHFRSRQDDWMDVEVALPDTWLCYWRDVAGFAVFKTSFCEVVVWIVNVLFGDFIYQT